MRHFISSSRIQRALHGLLMALLLCLFGGSSPAFAHPDLDEAKRLAADLEFEAALSSFEAALQSGQLSRAELVQLLAERVLVLHALHRKEQLVQDFVWLSAIAPDYRLDLRAAPDLTAMWTSIRDQGRGPMTVTLEASSSEQGELEARATLGGTVPEGARARLWLRRPGGEFEALALPELKERSRTDSSVDLYAQAVGLGNVVLAEDHSAEDPLQLKTSAATSEEDGSSEQRPSWAKRHKGWLIGAAVVVAAGAVVAGVLLARPGEKNNDKTNLQPMVTF